MAEQPPTPQTYFAGLQDILRIQTEILTRVLPHPGERGDNDDEHFKNFLRRVLPHKYSIGTGFMISSNSQIPPSAQSDIVIYDEFNNSPLYRELSASVYPIEIVYSAIEVKRNLQSKDVVPTVENIARVRRLAKEKQYVTYGAKQVSGFANPVVVEVEFQEQLAPRTFVVAYDTQYASINSLMDAWIDALAANGSAHLHGCLVLKKNWFLTQLGFIPDPVFLSFEDNALVRFLSYLLTTISSMPLGLANMKRYFTLDDAVSSLDTDPHEPGGPQGS